MLRSWIYQVKDETYFIHALSDNIWQVKDAENRIGVMIYAFPDEYRFFTDGWLDERSTSWLYALRYACWVVHAIRARIKTTNDFLSELPEVDKSEQA